MRISHYLDQLKAVTESENDKEMAKKMGWSHSVPSHWRTGKRFMDNATAGHISELIDVPVIEIIAAVEADREEVTGQKSFWTSFFQTRMAKAATPATLAIVAAGVTSFLTPSPVQAATRAILRAGHCMLCQIRSLQRKAIHAV